MKYQGGGEGGRWRDRERIFAHSCGMLCFRVTSQWNLKVRTDDRDGKITARAGSSREIQRRTACGGYVATWIQRGHLASLLPHSCWRVRLNTEHNHRHAAAEANRCRANTHCLSPFVELTCERRSTKEDPCNLFACHDYEGEPYFRVESCCETCI